MTALRPPGSGARRLAAYVARRIAWAAFVVYAVVSAIFALFVIAPDWSDATEMWLRALGGEEVTAEDPPPLSEQYVDWMVSFFSLDWGESETAAVRVDGADGFGGGVGEFGGASNVAAVAEALPVTLAYVLPATVMAFALALVAGYYAARRPRSWIDRLCSGSTYLLFSLPNFFLGAIIFYTLRDLDPNWFPDTYAAGAGLTTGNVLWLALPGAVLTTHLLAGHFRYVRTETRSALVETYVTLARAKGAGPRRIARHVFRAAAVPLVTLFVTELVGVILVAVFVLEVVFQVPGVGQLAYQAILNRDLDLVVILTGLFATTVVLANLFQDLAALALDPRADG